jgi:hypothetical protein
MRILFDQGVPAPLKAFLANSVDTCYDRKWSHLANGELIAKVELEYDAFVTTDKNLRYQQNLQGRRIAILVLPTTRWPILKPHGPLIGSAIEDLQEGDFKEWEFPD